MKFNINWDRIKFKMADDYDEFGVSLININYSFESDDFIAFVELHGDLNIVGYAIVWGFNEEAKDITVTYSDSQFNIAKKEYLEFIKESFN